MKAEHRIGYLRTFLSLGMVTVLVLSPGITRAEEQSVPEARKVAARVNGKPIYEERLKSEVEKGLKTFRKYGMRGEDTPLVRRLRKRALDKMIGEELIYQESQKLTIEDIDERVKLKLKAIESKYGTGERIEKHLKLRDLTMAGVRESLKAKVHVDEYLEKQGISEPEIPEERIREAYDASPNTYSREETIKVSHILIGVDSDAGAEEKEQARQNARCIRTELLEGEDFSKMAKAYSDCNSASGGGDLRYIKRGYMPEGFDRVAFAMEKGVVSDVVETKFGYHIIVVFDKIPAGITPYEEVRDFIKKFLQGEEAKKKLAAHIAELKREAKIEILTQH